MSLLSQAMGIETDPLKRFLFGDHFRIPTASGEKVSEQTALSLSAYYASIRNISDDIARMPLKIIRKSGGRTTVERDHPAYRLMNRQPNKMMVPMSFRATIIQWALGWGNGFAEIVRDGTGRPVEMWPIHPSRVQVVRDGNDDLKWRVSNEIGTHIDIDDSDMFNLVGMGDGVVGYSVLVYGAETMGLSLAAQKFGGSFFRNGMGAGGAIEVPHKVTTEQATQMREAWQSVYGSAANGNSPVILPQGAKWQRVSIPPEEAQFLETRKFQVTDIARFFRIQPHKIQDLERATYSNIEAQNLEYTSDSLGGWATKFEQEVDRKLIGDDAEVYSDHDFAQLLRGDSNARAEYYQGLFNVGAISPDEIRAMEGMDATGQGGDRYYMQGGMATTKEIVGRAEQQEDEDAYNNSEDEDKDGQDKESGDQTNLADEQKSAEQALECIKPAMVAAIDRLTQREQKAIEMALGKAQKREDDASYMREWASDFYARTEPLIVDALSPIVESAGRIMGVDHAAGVAHVMDSAERMCREAANHLRPVCTPQLLHAVVMEAINV